MYVDPRGPRFVAAVTTVVLAVTLATGSGWLAAAQALVFGIGAAAGLKYAPYAVLFRRFVRPRLAPPTELEVEGPPRFAQAVGFGFATAAAAGYLTGPALLGVFATALALAAAFLNAVVGLCLGCQMQLRLNRLLGRPAVCRVPVSAATVRS